MTGRDFKESLVGDSFLISGQIRRKERNLADERLSGFRYSLRDTEQQGGSIKPTGGLEQ